MKRIALSLLIVLVAIPAAADEEADRKTYTAKELEEIVGPVALYPEQVLSSVLPATTAPLDVIKAARWLSQQEGEVEAAPEDAGWDAAVQALIQFPDVLQWMAENLEWMEQMGYAVINQEEDVLAAIQTFRKKTKDAGNLESNDKQQVVVEEETQIIQIQPAEPTVIYVPQYDPVYVTQPVASHPPSYGGYFWAGVTVGVLGAWAWHEIKYGGGYWGGGIHYHREVNFNYNRNGQINRTDINRNNLNRWKASPDRMRTQPVRAPRGAGGRVGYTRKPQWDKRRSPVKTGRGGVTAPKRRPSAGGGRRPAATPRRGPSPSPALGGNRARIPESPRGGASRGARPDRRAAPSGRSGLGGNRSGSSARRSSNRGRSSLGSSRSRSGGRSARGGGGGRRGGGGARRGGGGRRR
ncbi:MAG: DUF3300 domain-containing protein [Planctomycetota bacterium]|nr:DUF3300 domain-containing protein [Planctomycetota bacterium]